MQTMIYMLSLRFFLLAHFDLCKGKSLRLKKDPQMQTVKRRGAPEASEAGSSSKVPKPSEDSDVDDSDRETE